PGRRVVLLGLLVVCGAGAVSTAGGTRADRGSESVPARAATGSAFQETTVTFSFGAPGKGGGRSFAGSGSGKMSFFEPMVEGALMRAHGSYSKSTVTIQSQGSSATLRVRPTGYTYSFSFLASLTFFDKFDLYQSVRLVGDITRSTIRSMPV